MNSLPVLMMGVGIASQHFDVNRCNEGWAAGSFGVGYYNGTPSYIYPYTYTYTYTYLFVICLSYYIYLYIYISDGEVYVLGKRQPKSSSYKAGDRVGFEVGSLNNECYLPV